MYGKVEARMATKAKTKAPKTPPKTKGSKALTINNNPTMKKIWKSRYLFAFLLPCFVLTVIFSYAPLYGLIGAFQDYNPFKGFSGSKWVGWKNFQYLLKLPDIKRTLINTVRIGVVEFIFGFPAPIILALMINEVRSKAFKRISQTLSYIPNFISWVVCAGLFGALLGGTGPVNDILIAIGLRDEPIYFFNEPSIFTPLAVGAGIWKGVGFGSILYLAALTAISPELYESAQLDGASKLQQLWHISIPGIMPTIALQLVLSLASILSVSFDKIYNMQNTMNISASDTIDTYIYRIAMHGAIKDYSRGLALGLVRGVVCFVLFIIANRTSKKIGIGSAV